MPINLVDIASPENPKIKEARKLLTAKGRQRSGRFLLEGLRLIEEAFFSGIRLETLFYTPEFAGGERGRLLLENVKKQGVKTFSVSDRVSRALSDTEQPQGLIAVAQIPVALPKRPVDAIATDLTAAHAIVTDAIATSPRPWGNSVWEPVPDTFPPWPVPANSAQGTVPLVLLADGVQDPGNLGTMIRAADAAGATAVLTTPGTVDIYNPKVLRAGMGSHFHLPVVPLTDITSFLSRIAELSFLLLVAEAQASTSIYEEDLRGPTIFVVGNEGAGVSPVLRAAGRPVAIPMPGRAESLNAAMAATILLFEAVRQRRR